MVINCEGRIVRLRFLIFKKKKKRCGVNVPIPHRNFCDRPIGCFVRISSIKPTFCVTSDSVKVVALNEYSELTYLCHASSMQVPSFIPSAAIEPFIFLDRGRVSVVLIIQCRFSWSALDRPCFLIYWPDKNQIVKDHNGIYGPSSRSFVRPYDG